MKPAAFDYARPDSVAEAVRLLALHGPRARVLAGGQSLMPLLVRRLERPSWVVDINRLEGLAGIELLPMEIRMGALVRQEEARRSTIVRDEVPGVAAALAWVANPVVRQRGTVIGNLLANTPGAELPAVALAYGAQFVLRSASGEDTVSAADLLRSSREFSADTLVTHVLWPRRPGPVGFHEVARRHGHTPVVSAMVARSGAECRVAVSGVCATGLSCPTMARVIDAAFPFAPDYQALAAALRADVTGEMYGDASSDATYRLDVAPVVAQRAAESMTQRAGQPSWKH